MTPKAQYVFTKLAKKSFIEKHKGLITAGIGAAAAVGTYALARKAAPFMKKVPDLNIITDEPTSALKSTFNRLWRGGKEIETKTIKKPLKGTTYFEVDQASIAEHKIRTSKGSAVFNKASVIEKTLQDKLRYGQLKSPHVPASWTIKSKTRGKQFGTPEELAQHLVKLKGGPHYFKPRIGAADSEWGSHTTTKNLQSFIEHPKHYQGSGKNPRQALQRMIKDPSSYVGQSQAQFDPRDERRMHLFTDENSRVKIVGPIINRMKTENPVRNVLHKATIPGRKETEKAFQDIINRNPRFAKDIKGKKLMLGLDVVKSKGQVKILDVNDQSGFAMSPRPAQAIYKHITSRDTPLYAGIKGTAVGGTVAGGMAIAQREKKAAMIRLPVKAGKAGRIMKLIGTQGTSRIYGNMTSGSYRATHPLPNKKKVGYWQMYHELKRTADMG